ncbi:MAG: hypothetical protein E7047_07435 [Lentisphaerae bacterium]|nr:hypothetical protein [Lentisphaerota bacterium]
MFFTFFFFCFFAFFTFFFFCFFALLLLFLLFPVSLFSGKLIGKKIVNNNRTTKSDKPCK